MWREARSSDDEAIVALCVALYEEDPAGDPVPREHHERTLAKLREEPVRGRAYALDVEGVVRGYALVIGYWSNELGGEIRTVDELYVAPGYRSRGWASALIDALGAGAVALELEVTPDNARARAL